MEKICFTTQEIILLTIIVSMFIAVVRNVYQYNKISKRIKRHMEEYNQKRTNILN